MKFKYSYIAVSLMALGLIGWMLQAPQATGTPAPINTAESVTAVEALRISAPRPTQPLMPLQVNRLATRHPSIGRIVNYTPPALPDLNALNLPQTETGGYMLFPVDSGESQGHMEIQDDLQDPLTALGACTRWIVGCVEPGNRSIDDCARSVPQCTTDKPWEEEAHCCPSSCFDSYATLREAGIESITAFDTVYFADGSCFPGLEELLTGVSPAPPAHY